MSTSSSTSSSSAVVPNRDDVLKVIASLTADERAALGIGSVAAATPGSQTPKLSHVLDKVPDGDVAKVVAACRNGLQVAADDPSAGDDRVGSSLLAASPLVHAAAIRNSLYRRKPNIVHSLEAIVGYLARRGGGK